MRRTWKTNIEPEYREYRIEVTVRVHRCTPLANDEFLIQEIVNDIDELATGDVVIVEATRKVED